MRVPRNVRSWNRCRITSPRAAGQRRRDRRRYDTEIRAPVELAGEDLGRLIQSLEDEMRQAAKELRFEYAARLRDEVAELRREMRELSEVTG